MDSCREISVALSEEEQPAFAIKAVCCQKKSGAMSGKKLRAVGTKVFLCQSRLVPYQKKNCVMSEAM